MAKSTFTILLLTVFVSFSVYSQKYYVPDDYLTIQSAIDGVAEHDTIIVRPGTYYENLDYSGKNLVVASMIEETGDKSYIDSTIIDGGGLDRVVKFISAEDSTAVLKGFTIQNGYAFKGGGIYCWKASPILSDLKVIQNETTSDADAAGGGIYLTISNALLRNIIIKDNVSHDFGGGLCINNRSYVLIEHVDINNNRVTNEFGNGKGGGFSSKDNAVCFMKNVSITDNISERWGGAIAVEKASELNLINVTIANNEAGNGGGGIYTAYGFASYFIGNSICYNNVPNEIYFDPICTYVDFSVCYSNIKGLSGLTSSTEDVIIYILEGNIDAPPLFVDASNGNYRLDNSSSCIDAGTDFYYYQYQIKIDIAEDLYSGVMPDMGAFEWDLPFGIIPQEASGRCCTISNPAADQINITFKEEMSENTSFILVDAAGNQLIEQNCPFRNKENESIAIDVSHLPSGIYFLIIRSSVHRWTEKIIVL